ncbi:MAG: DUF308 domain-containing protein [Ignavibacteria bacterium]|nr:DUF308 domain-containing protein [Ignavibacteria bacterium]
MLERIQKKWWLLLLRGILALIFGFIAIFSPGMVLVTLLFYFGFVALFSGLFLVIEGIAIKSDDRGMRILEGVLSILFGLLFIFITGFVFSFVMYFIAFWAIIGGIMQIIYAIKLRKEISNEWLAILNGVITLIFGILVLTNILAGASALIMVFGFFAIISGILMIMLSFKVKGLKKA